MRSPIECFVPALLALAACETTGGTEPDTNPSPSPDATAAGDTPGPAGVTDPRGAWQLLARDTAFSDRRLHGAAVLDGALYVSSHVGQDGRVEITRFSSDGARTAIGVPYKIQNTSAARLVRAGDKLLMVVPYYLGELVIRAYVLDGEAFVEDAVISATARTSLPVALTSTDEGAAIAYVEGDGSVVVQHWRADEGWRPVLEPIPWAGGETYPSQLSLDWSEAGYLVAYGLNENQELRATAHRSTASGWEQLGPAGIDGALGFLDVAWHDGAPHFLRSIPTHHILRWDGTAWSPVISGVDSEELYDLRAGDDALYWYARGGASGPRLERLRAGVRERFPSDTLEGPPVEIGPQTTFPEREILAADGEVYWVYDDITGNVWKVLSYRWAAD